ALTESDYTADSWTAMQTALADATALAEATTGKTQAEVDEITAALTAAVDALVDITALTAAIETAQALTESSYTADSWTAMQTALADATALAEATTGKTQAEVDEITAALTAAIDALEVPVDTDALTSAIKQAQALTESDYTAESWADLQTALTAAQTVAANASATQTEVDEAAAALTAAVAALTVYVEPDTGTSEEKVTTPAATKITSAINRAKGVKLTWNAVDNATSYQVYRKIGSGSWKKVKTTSSTTWLDTAAMKNGTKYQYKVYAVNEGGKSKASATKTIYRLTAKHFTRAKNVSSKKISLKWTRNTRATGYVIQYSTSKSFTSSTTKTVKVKGNKNLTTTLKNLKKGKTYYIRMRAYKTSGSVTSYAGWSKVKTVKVKK
ncbi:MAG: fibronectin type III domain-containing protein, partial [Clostridiales bacterium]|nr:fibronectin type III domain-containing protein [Clostridiales bacterium]